MKKFLLLMAMVLPLTCMAQDETEKPKKSKMDVFASETGHIVKFIDKEVEKLKGTYSIVNYTSENRVRKVIKGGEAKYFYRMEKKSKDNDGSIAFIEYSDLKEIISAMEVLINDAKKDLELKPEYLENKFVTEDYFVVGYFIKKSNITWFIRLEEYGLNKSLYFNNKYEDIGTYILNNFIEAKNVMENWMKEGQ